VRAKCHRWRKTQKRVIPNPVRLLNRVRNPLFLAFTEKKVPCPQKGRVGTQRPETKIRVKSLSNFLRLTPAGPLVPRQEFHLQFVSDFLKIRICSNQSGLQFQRQTCRKTIGVSKSMYRFELSRSCRPIAIHRYNVQWQLLHTSRQRIGFRLTPGFSHRVNHFSPVNRRHLQKHPSAGRFLHHPIHSLCPRPACH